MIKNINLLLIITSSILLSISCKKSNNTSQNSTIISYSNGVRFDTNIYISITFRGQTLTTHGFLPLGYDTPPYSSSEISQSNDGQGNVIYKLNLVEFANATKLFLGSSFYEYNLKHVNIDASLYASKVGSVEPKGKYIISSGSFSDLRESIQKYYNVEKNGIINVATIDNKFITGTFTCTLIDIDGVTKIPASGSFRLPNVSFF
jgi:hypothetical protein